MSATSTFQVPADDPAAVLFRLVRRAKLPYSNRFVSNAVASHPQPQSLLSLVQVAPHLGLSVTAAKVEPAGLDDLHLPAVVHFATGGGGFGVLESVTPGHVELWDSRNGRRRVDRTAFLQAWSGIVALAQNDDSQRKTEPGARKQRMIEALGGGIARPDLAGKPEGPVLAAVTAALIGILVVAAVAGHSASTRWAAALLVALSLAGAGIGAVLSYATAGMTANVNVPGCPRGKLVNCESVLNSVYSKVRGIPMSDFGTSFFTAALLVVATAAAFPSGAVPWTALGYAYFAAVPAALLLVGAQFAMRKFCTMCLVVHGLVVAGAAVSSTFAGEAGPGEVLRALLLFAFYFSIVLFAAIPFFTRARRTRQMIETQHRVSGSPFATLAHLSTETPAPLRGPECGVRLPGPPSPHELVLFAHPTCKQCSHEIKEVAGLAAAGMSEVYVTLLPRYPEGDERRVCEAILAAGLAGGPQTFLGAFFYAKNRFMALMEEDFVAQIAGETSLERDAIESRIETARKMIAHTDAVAEGRVDGTPAMFFDARLYPYAVPLDHLTLLLQKHSELLPQRPGAAAKEVAPA